MRSTVGQFLETEVSPWYSPWQWPMHAAASDYRKVLNSQDFILLYEMLNDVRLLNERIDRSQNLTLCDVGCATGDFYQYLQMTYPQVEYYGTDISVPAIERAKIKYPAKRFMPVRPGMRQVEAFHAVSGCENAHVIYSRDVVHHQVKPFEFLSELIEFSSEALIIRCRTRDVGATEWNPEKSRQRHYGGWVPYIVINLQELIDRFRLELPGWEMIVYRSYVILGGRYQRALPPECSFKRTGTAETAIGIFRTTHAPGRVTIKNRIDNRNTRWDRKFEILKRLSRSLFSKPAHDSVH